MLEQYQEWNTIEQETMQAVIRKLLSQTFLLERKYEKKAAGWPRTGNMNSAPTIWNF